MKRFIFLAVALASTSVHATSLVPGNNTLTGTTLADEPNLAGTVVEDDLQSFTFGASGGTFSGTVQSRVVKSVDGTYDFYWRLSGVSFSGTAQASIEKFRLGQIGMLPTGLNANYRTDGVGDVGPNSAYVFEDPNGFVNFNFDEGLFPGQNSYSFFLDTEATSYSRTGIYDLTSGVDKSIIYTTFAPVAGVPEPASWAMMLGGFGMVGGALRRRQRPSVRFA